MGFASFFELPPAMEVSIMGYNKIFLVTIGNVRIDHRQPGKALSNQTVILTADS